ncbi:MAG: hypothetical protein AAAB13_04470 [Pseudomonas sp.]
MNKWSRIALGSFALLSVTAGLWLCDEPLDPQAQAWLDEVAAPKAESLAYYQLQGLDAPAGSDPQVVGRERLLALASADRTPPPALASTSLPLPERDELCSLNEKDCLQRLQRGEIKTALLTQHAELLRRYRQLLQLQDYRSFGQVDWPDVTRPLSALQRGNLLLGLQAFTLAHTGQGGEALELLQQDLRQLRGWLAAADSLVLKMLLTQMLADDLQTISGLHQIGLLPQPEAQPLLSAQERSMRLPVLREFSLISIGLLKLTDEPAVSGKLGGKLAMRVLYRPQMSVNSQMPVFRQLVTESELNAATFRQALEQPMAARVARRWRNPVGTVLGDVAVPDYRKYVARLHDLDARLRLFNLLRGLPADFQPSTRSLGALTEADNPYQAGDPPYWDSAEHSICYQGPLPDDRQLRCLTWHLTDAG